MELAFDSSTMTSEEFLIALKYRASLVARKSQLHKRTHTPTCYKYAPSRASKQIKARCRFGKLVPLSRIVIGASKRRSWQLLLRRRQRWINTYNELI